MPPPTNNNTNWGQLAGAGLQVGVGVALGAIVGTWLDHHFGWTPWGVVVGCVLGVSSGMYLLIKEAMRNSN